uniref:(California timema) hypothetical protein n=1 Tax=Timema californicum TaxID=61474 RepID=A0A7R9PD15_TIMCA|nr:unnamed protein product [Timema californicum]
MNLNSSLGAGSVATTLTIAHALRKHSGNYTCAVGSLASATVAVHILNEITLAPPSQASVVLSRNKQHEALFVRLKSTNHYASIVRTPQTPPSLHRLETVDYFHFTSWTQKYQISTSDHGKSQSAVFSSSLLDDKPQTFGEDGICLAENDWSMDPYGLDEGLLDNILTCVPVPALMDGIIDDYNTLPFGYQSPCKRARHD